MAAAAMNDLSKDPELLEKTRAILTQLSAEGSRDEKVHYGYFLKFLEFYEGTNKRAIYEIPREYKQFLLREFNLSAP